MADLVDLVDFDLLPLFPFQLISFFSLPWSQITRFLTTEPVNMTLQENRAMWDQMLTDRSYTGSLLTCLITKALILGYYELKPELTDSLLNMLTSKPLVTEVDKLRATSSVKNDMKRQSKPTFLSSPKSTL